MVTTSGITARQLRDKAFQAAFSRHFLLRLHMALILGGTFAVAIAATQLLLWMHVNNLAWRYGLAVSASFGAFLLLVRGWLGYIGYCATRAQRRSASSGDADWLSAINFSSDGVGSAAQSFQGAGGAFGGGGASGGWGDPVTSQSLAAAPLSPSHSGGGFSLPDCGDDDLGLVIAAVAVAVAILLAAFYLIYAAPAILGETAFQAALAASLARHAKKAGSTSWTGSIVKSTVLPFLAILVLAIFAGWFAQKRCPSALRLRDAFSCASRPARAR